VIGRTYEDRHAPADVRWFWSITVHVDPALGIRTHGRVTTLQLAVEPQQVILGQTETADGCFGLQASMRAMPIVAMQPMRQLGRPLL
jgi:hypothetical protein